MTQEPKRRDIIVAGGSAGALAPLKALAAALPPDLPAAVFVVIHTSPDSPGLLAEILGSSSRMPVARAEDGAPIRHGRISVAPPDHHLVLRDGAMRLVRGPRENRFRPAIDPLFRTAAQAFGTRVVSLLFSGGLNDGAYGMMLVKQHGGICVVQDPDEAETPSMVLSALEHVAVDHVLPTVEMAPLLVELAGQDAPQTSGEPVATSNPGHRLIDPQQNGGSHTPPGELAPLACPECGGTLWEMQYGRLMRYECHEGHAFTGEALLSEQSDAVETALWSALRTLDENAELLRRMAENASKSDRHESAKAFESRAYDAEQQAQAIRNVLLTDKRKRA